MGSVPPLQLLDGEVGETSDSPVPSPEPTPPQPEPALPEPAHMEPAQPIRTLEPAQPVRTLEPTVIDSKEAESADVSDDVEAASNEGGVYSMAADTDDIYKVPSSNERVVLPPGVLFQVFIMRQVLPRLLRCRLAHHRSNRGEMWR